MWSQGRGGASNIWSLLCFPFKYVYICRTNSEETVSCCSLPWWLMIYTRVLECPALIRVLCFFLPPGQNYCSVNNGGCTHLCLATPTGRSCKCPDNAVGVGCVERDSGYWKKAAVLWELTLFGLFWPQTRSHSALLNYSCWKCHWKPEVNLLCLLLLRVNLIYVFTFPIALIKSQPPLRFVNTNPIILSFLSAHKLRIKLKGLHKSMWNSSRHVNCVTLWHVWISLSHGSIIVEYHESAQAGGMSLHAVQQKNKCFSNMLVCCVCGFSVRIATSCVR